MGSPCRTLASDTAIQGRAWLLQATVQQLLKNPRGTLSNNHTERDEVSSAVPQIYTEFPHMCKDDLLLLLLCQGSIGHHSAAVCIVLPLCISS